MVSVCRFAFGVAVCGGLLFVGSVRSDAADAKRVLIVRDESPEMPGGRVLVDQIESTLRKSSAGPIEFFIESLDTRRFTGDQYERRLADLLVEKYSGKPLDLVVAYSEPAFRFVTRVRETVFPRVPVVFGLVDQRLVDPSMLPPKSSVVYVQLDAIGTARLALRTYPRMRRLLVVGGASRFDRGWQRVIREDLAPIDKTLTVDYDVASSVSDLTRRIAALPPDTVVLYTWMTRDGAGTPTQPVEVLQALRAVSPVPILGLSSSYVGHGVLGGVMVDFKQHGQDLADAAARMMAGELPPPSTTRSAVTMDWREMNRFDIAGAALPAEARVEFREPTLWERQKNTILIAASIVSVETALVLALFIAIRRRREGQRELEARLSFERLQSELSMQLLTDAYAGSGEVIDRALRRVASGLGFDHVWRRDFNDPARQPWDSPLLRAGQAVCSERLDDLPPEIREELRASGCSSCSSIAVPLAPDGVVTAAIFWVSRGGPATARARVQELEMVAATIAHGMRRNQAEDAREESDRLKTAILASLPAHVAVLDRDGAIIAANDSWAVFGRASGIACAGIAGDPGCEGCARQECSGASAALAAIAAVCHGSAGRQLEYRCSLPEGDRWFLMTAEPLRRQERGAVVTHFDITERKVGEIALRESEDRFRRMADSLPVAIWMSDTSGDCIYVNKLWLEMVGRDLRDEIGIGWLDSVHPADRADCRARILAAFAAREPFRIEYRVRAQEGAWRTVIDTGLPRYGSDGAFHGYVGGCLDITERTHAEQALHDVNLRLMGAQDEERRRIARDLHDHLSQQLALLAIDLQQLSMHPPKSPDDLTPMVQEAWRRTTEIASDVHAISHRLHPSKMESLGLVTTIKAHCRDVSRQNFAVEFTSDNVPRDIPADRALSIFRVIEEALSNVQRHSGASSARVALAWGDDELLLRVSDNGRGFKNEGRPSGIGLISMRERIESLEGRLEIVSRPGRGTVLEARVPTAALRPSAGAIAGARAESA
jgi:PAS domain S-box-containing protein